MNPNPASVDAHAFCAAWNAGEAGSSPVEGPTLMPAPPFAPNVGSGKLVSPCVRMHCENFSIACFRAADSGGGCPPFGKSDRQLCIADWNAGELTATPLTLRCGPEPERWLCWISNPPRPLPPGSGKLDTPCVRMHCANLSPAAAFSVEALFAGEEEPHAASARPAPSTATK